MIKWVNIVGKLHSVLPRYKIVTSKQFVRPYLHYGHVLYDQPNNVSFCKKIESLQYQACLAVIVAIKGASHNTIYEELGLALLKSSRRGLGGSELSYKFLNPRKVWKDIINAFPCVVVFASNLVLKHLNILDFQYLRGPLLSVKIYWILLQVSEEKCVCDLNPIRWKNDRFVLLVILNISETSSH